mmetsp:Transcript_30173/g.75997  ORF Transcript_30173/g.75997 Transcript_30173/m.75997 type:complete len:203 (-) Transcript_30173:212-820(-)
MTHLGCRVDKLEFNLLCGLAADLGQQGLTKGDEALAAAHDRALDHDPVLIHLTVVREAADGGDSLLGQIVLGHGIVRVVLGGLPDAVDFLVDLRAVVVTALAGTWHLELHAGGMPRTDASHLAEATMRLPCQASYSPTGDDAVEALALGGADDVDHLVLAEDIRDLDLLFEEACDKVNLRRGGAAVHLDLLDVRLLLADLYL